MVGGDPLAPPGRRRSPRRRRRRAAASRARAASPRARACTPRPPRRPSATSCRARRGPRRSRRGGRPTTDRATTPTASRARCRRARAGTAPDPAARPSRRATRLGRSGVRAEQLALEARVAHEGGEVLLGRALVAGRVDGVEADQLREQLHRFAAELLGHGHARELRPRLGGARYLRLRWSVSSRSRGGTARGHRWRCGCARARSRRSSASRRCWGPTRALRRALEAGPPALDDPARPARLRQDDAGADRRRLERGGARGAQRRRGGPCRGARGDRARAPPRRPDRLLPRRDPPLQQGPAGRAAAGGRGRRADADRGDHGEPALRGDQRAALAGDGL